MIHSGWRCLSPSVGCACSWPSSAGPPGILPEGLGEWRRKWLWRWRPLGTPSCERYTCHSGLAKCLQEREKNGRKNNRYLLWPWRNCEVPLNKWLLFSPTSNKCTKRSYHSVLCLVSLWMVCHLMFLPSGFAPVRPDSLWDVAFSWLNRPLLELALPLAFGSPLTPARNHGLRLLYHARQSKNFFIFCALLIGIFSLTKSRHLNPSP